MNKNCTKVELQCSSPFLLAWVFSMVGYFISLQLDNKFWETWRPLDATSSKILPRSLSDLKSHSPLKGPPRTAGAFRQSSEFRVSFY